jgi:NDP-sugar pyrophosphorylase family protein
MQAVIIAGGNGIRLHPYTSILPKPLLPVHNVPVIEIIVRQLRHFGFTRISISLGYLAELIKLFLGDGAKYGLRLDYCVEEKPLGTISPLTLLDDLEPTILVMNADLLTNLDFRAFMHFHQEQGAQATIGMFRHRLPMEFGVLETDGGFRLSRYREKPELQLNVSMGIYAIESRLLQNLPRNARVDFPEFINTLISAGEKIIGYPFEGFWLDLGRPRDFKRAMREFEQVRGDLHID